jgi:YfiH family protein
MWLSSPILEFKHGFSTRHKGVSMGKFYSLNLGGSEDEHLHVEMNREIALRELELNVGNLCLLKQVHGSDVCVAQHGYQTGDALVTKNKELVLAVSVADCYPILFADEKSGVIGAAHAGWRGTVAAIAGKTVAAMKNLGAEPQRIKVAIGQGISAAHFIVGSEVKEQFNDGGFPPECMPGNRIDLVAANIFVLEKAGIARKNIWSMDRCTFENDFFSHRRDHGVTGRMWGLITMS